MFDGLRWRWKRYCPPVRWSSFFSQGVHRELVPLCYQLRNIVPFVQDRHPTTRRTASSATRDPLCSRAGGCYTSAPYYVYARIISFRSKPFFGCIFFITNVFKRHKSFRFPNQLVFLKRYFIICNDKRYTNREARGIGRPHRPQRKARARFASAGGLTISECPRRIKFCFIHNLFESKIIVT